MMFFGSGALDGAQHRDRTVADFHHQEIHIVQAHAVRAGAGATQAQRAVHQLVTQGLGHFALFRQGGVDQVAEVEVVVAHMADEGIAGLSENSGGQGVFVQMARCPKNFPAYLTDCC